MARAKPLKIGPVIGHTTDSTIRIWGRGSTRGYRKGWVRVESTNDGAVSFHPLPLFEKLNATGFVTLEPLNPDAEYLISAAQTFKGIDPAKADWSRIHQSRVKTFPASSQATNTSFILASCRHQGRFLWQGKDKTIKAINEIIENASDTKPDFVIQCGDQIYADHHKGIYVPSTPPSSYRGFCKVYQDTYTAPYRTLTSSVPMYFAFDDHEVMNDWSIGKFKRQTKLRQTYKPRRSPQHRHLKPKSKKGKWQFQPAILNSGLEAYDTYQTSVCDPDFTPSECLARRGAPYLTSQYQYDYQFNHGQSGFFVMDIRYERDEYVNGTYQMISERQLDALIEYLNGDHKIKFVVTAVPIFPDTKGIFGAPLDKWRGGHKQRARILDHIADNNIQNVIFLSGDVHCSLGSKIELKPGLSTYNVISSALNWPIIGLGDDNFDFGPLAGSDYESTIISKKKDEKTADVVKENNFTWLRLEGNEFKVGIYSGDNEVLDSYNIPIS